MLQGWGWQLPVPIPTTGALLPQGQRGCRGRGRRKHQAGLREKGHLGVFSADTSPKPTTEPPSTGRGLWPVPPLLGALGGIFIPDFSQFASQEAPVESPFLRLPKVVAIIAWRLPRALAWLWGGHPLIQARCLLPLGSKEIPKARRLLGGGWLGWQGGQRAGERTGTGTSVWDPSRQVPQWPGLGHPSPPMSPPHANPPPAPWV